VANSYTDNTKWDVFFETPCIAVPDARHWRIAHGQGVHKICVIVINKTDGWLS